MSELKNKYRKNGTSELSDFELLCLLLEYTTDQANARDTARRLLDKFGSLSCVLERTPQALIEAVNLSEQAAVLLNMQSALLRVCCREKHLSRRTDEDNLKSVIKSLFIGATTEHFYMISLSNENKILSMDLLSTGTLSRVNIYTRAVMEIAMRNNADKIVLTHNHPNGIAFPSAEDIGMTHILAEAVELIGIRLEDHFIVTNKTVMSMRNDFHVFDSPSPLKSNTKFTAQDKL